MPNEALPDDDESPAEPQKTWEERCRNLPKASAEEEAIMISILKTGIRGGLDDLIRELEAELHQN